MRTKIILPIILAGIVLTVGLVAFMPIYQANTIHTTLIQGISGASAVVTKEVTIDQSGGSGSEFHHFILTSDKPFYIHDITVKGNMNTTDASGDFIRVKVSAYPSEYGNGADSAGTAKDDGRLYDVLDDNGGDSGRVLDGGDDDDFFPVTWSMMLADATEDVSDPGFGPDQNIVVEFKFSNEGCCSDTQFNGMVTFYLRGVTAEDVDIKVHERTVGI